MSGAGRNGKNGICHESVHKQQVWLLRNRESCVRDTGSGTDSDRDDEFYGVRDL